MTKTVLITGVTGQDGSYMADYLLAHTDYNIYGMVRRTAKPDYSNIAEALKNPRFKLVVGDLADGGSIDALVANLRPDYLINLAAQSFVGSSWDLAEQTFDVGAIGVIRCLEAIRKHVPECRFYSAGSSEQFGDVAYSPQDENHPNRPRSPYAAAKCAAAHIVKVYRETYNLYAVHGVLFNHESPRRGEEFVTRKITLGVARIAAAMKQGEPFEPIKLGNLNARRDWSDARDFVEGIWRMLNQEVYNPALKHLAFAPSRVDVTKDLKEYVLSSNETHPIREFVDKAFSYAGLTGKWVNPTRKPEDERFVLCDDRGRPLDSDVTLVAIDPRYYRPNEVSCLFGWSKAIRDDLGWTPANTFDGLVRDMVGSDLKEAGL